MAVRTRIAQSVQQQGVGWMAEKSGFNFLHGQEILLFSTASRLAMGFSLLSSGNQGSFHMEVKCLGHEADGPHQLV
jgi:hypothetical protein